MGGERMRLLTVSPEQDARGVRALKRALDWLEGKPGGQALPQTVDLWEVDGVLMLLTSDHLLGSQALTQDDWIRLDRNVSVAWLIQLALTLGGLHEAGLALGHLAAHDLAARSERDPVVVAQLGQMVELETLPQDLALEMIDRDIFAVGKLLLRAFTTVPVGRVLGLFEAFGYEPEAMMDLGLVRPGLMQALSGALASMTDLSYLSMDELLDGLLQLRAEMQRPLTFRTGIASSCGNYPLRRTDQDSAGMTETRYAYHGKQRHLGFYCVADGVGGEEAGELASQLAISSALSGFHRAIGAYTYGDLFTNTTAFARHLVKTAAQRLAIAGEEEPDVHKGATTFTGMLIAGERAGIGHIGDSRAYLLRNDRLIRLTRDHNLANIRVAVGELTPEEAEASGDDQRQLARYLDTGQEAPLEWIDGFDPALIPNLIQPEAPHAATPTFSGPSAAGLFSSQSDTEEPTSGLFGHPNPMAPGTPSALAVSAATPSRELNLPPARHNPPSLTVSTPLGELLAASLPSPPPDWSPAPPKAGPEEPTPPYP
ncbi:MAG: PP2C family serine/threonine-protein phosphatase [Myxococcota bacterium]